MVGVSKTFHRKKSIKQHLPFVFYGAKIGIIGLNGSGKSTLFNMVGGLDKPTAGSCFIDEIDMAQLTATELAWLRCRKIGYIFQTFNLIPVMTALENVTLPMILRV